MKLWEGIKYLEETLLKHSKRFLETSETLQKEHGWIVGVLYQKEIFQLAVNNMNYQGVPIDSDLLCVTMEQMSFTVGQRVFHAIMMGLQDDHRIFSMREN